MLLPSANATKPPNKIAMCNTMMRAYGCIMSIGTTVRRYSPLPR